MTITLAVLDGSIAIVALPTIAGEFNASASASVWIVNGFQLAVAMLLLPFASLGEIHGYRPDLGLRVFTPKALKGKKK